MRALRFQIVDPGLFSLKRAARAAIALPAIFAFADTVIQNQQTTFLAAIGSVAILVLTDFGGRPRTRFVAYLALAAAGAVLITLGTLCSQTPWLAVVAMAVVGFVVLLAGVINGYFAAARSPALLLFTFPVSLAAPPSAIPARLEGWALAASVGIAAVMLLWPSQPRDKLRAGIARATRALGDLLDAELSGDSAAIAEHAEAANAAVGELRRGFVATPYRATGPTGSTEALAFLVDELDWMLTFAAPGQGGIESGPGLCREENREVMAAAVAVLRASAGILDGEHRQPDLERLDRSREAVARTLAHRVLDATAPGDEVDLPAALEPSFRMRQLSFAARQVALNAQRASGASDRRWGSRESAGRLRAGLQATARLLVAHASRGSASFRNALRGAAGVSLAVFIGEVASLQHSFWVVLATLSVLRSNALGTGSTILQALAGTAAGIVVGGALVAAIGTDEAVLWAMLPPAVLLGAYAPRAISFAAGQAGFTIVLLVLFNLIQPTGWTVGLVRVEDVAVGFAVSLAVGVLFWPRGVSDLLRQGLGEAYARGADYLAASARHLVGATRVGNVETAQQVARAAANRLDEALRQYLSESPSQRADLDSASRLVAGATRLRLAAYSISMSPASAREARLDRRAADALVADVDGLRSWYQSLAGALANRTELPEPPPRHEHRQEVARWAGRAVAAGDESMVDPALGMLWAGQQLDNLRELGGQLLEPSAELTGGSARRAAGRPQPTPARDPSNVEVAA